MSDKRRGLGRGLGALIPTAPSGAARPSDVFFAERPSEGTGNQPGPERTDVDADSTPEDRGAQTNVPDRLEPATTATTAVAAAEKSSGEVRNEADAAELGATSETAADEPQGAPDSTTQATGQEELAPVPGAQFAELAVASIRPNPRQPRQVFDEDDMAELVHSISEIGVLQPIVVRPIPADERVAATDAQEADGNGTEVAYELIMGERRWRASAEAGNATVPAIIRSTADDDLLRDALLENLHRAQLNPLEEAAAYRQLLDDFGCTHDELAGRIGRSRPQISNTLRLLRLPPLVQRRVAAGVLSQGHARALLGLPDAGGMERLAQRIVAEGLSVRTVEEIVSLGGDQEKARRAPRMGTRHPQLEDLAARLSDRLDTRVGINLGKRKGKLTVEFASVDDLDRIIEQLGLQQS